MGVRRPPLPGQNSGERGVDVCPEAHELFHRWPGEARGEAGLRRGRPMRPV